MAAEFLLNDFFDVAPHNGLFLFLTVVLGELLSVGAESLGLLLSFEALLLVLGLFTGESGRLVFLLELLVTRIELFDVFN